MIENSDSLVKEIKSKKFYRPIEEFYLFIYLMEKGETINGIQVGKHLYGRNMEFNDKIDTYLYDKGMHSYIESD